MDEVYGVFRREYSDWNCLGFFDNEIDAEKCCMLGSDRYIIPILNLKSSVDLESIVPKYIYEFDKNFNDYSDNGMNGTLCNARNQQSRVEEFVWEKGNPKIIVITTTRDRDKALKIAHDLYAKWKYEHLLEEKGGNT